MLLAASTALAQTAHETQEQFEARTEWWRQAKFGMFIHWGLYAVPADATDLNGKHRIAEWYLSNKQVQVKDYEKFAAQLNPVEFDARKWVTTAKNAGMKYIVITSKHHDGFCMFDTKLTDYCITRATPWKHDPMKDLAAECQRQGIKLCFYHSIMDWHHPDYVPRRPWEKDIRPAEGADLHRYVDYMEGQLRELLTNYGPVGLIWFDGGWEHNANELRSAEINAMIRSIQPGILINDRNKLAEDYSTPEQSIPSNALPGGRLWETCMTMNDTWGYARNDNHWKSSEDLTRKLVDIASKGGNFLLNVGPTAEGVFPSAINERLAAIGAWMKVNNSCIYGTTKSPFRKLSFDGRATTKGGTLYLEVFNWPSGGLTLKDLETPVIGARALDGGEKLTTKVSETGGSKVLSISKPRKLDAVATVVELRLAGTPKVSEANLAVMPGADGVFVLVAGDAAIHGKTAQYDWQGVQRQDYIGSWTDAKDYVTWKLSVPRPGRYRVDVSYACPPGDEGSHFTVGLDGGAKLAGNVKATQGDRDFRSDSLGELDLPAGIATLAARIGSLANGPAMNLHEIHLTPVR